MENIHKQLFQRNLINEKQHDLLEGIYSNKIISLYYELRLMLYLGIMLFTGGVGYFAYQNMGEIGHLLSMFLISMSIFAGFYFIQKFAKPYSNAKVTVNQVYFDYILILVSLLIISLFAYIQVYFGLIELLIHWTSFISAGILFAMAYRYDNKALLSMGITALAAAIGISISPVDWVKGEWFASINLYITSILLGAFLVTIGQVSEITGIKKHFRFTYQNFGLLLYYAGCIAAIFDSSHEWLYALLMLISGLSVSYLAWNRKDFLFFLYSNIATYIAFTYLLYEVLKNSDDALVLLVYYFPASGIAYVIFLVRHKSYFNHE